MKSNYHFVFVSLIACACCIAGKPQDNLPVAAPNQDQLQSRVDQLESRIELLERIVFSSAKLSTMQAQRRLDDAAARLKNSQQLQLRGMITELELQQDRYQFEEAKKALELARSENRQNELVGELELLEAEQNLQHAKDRLRYARQLANRGFATQTEVDGNQRLVDDAMQRLENAKIKLEAAKQLEAIKDK